MRIGEWYYKKDDKNETILELPPPKKTENTNNQCPICQINSTLILDPYVTKCCGFVFCQICINKAIKEQNKCRTCSNFLNNSCIVKIYK